MNYINPDARLAKNMYKLTKYEVKHIIIECNKIFENQKKIDERKQNEIIEEKLEENNQILFDY